MLSPARIAELEKKIKELNDQIRVYKNELSDKQKEFAQEKADLQLVIDQQKKGGEDASTAELDKVKKDLEKAQKELQEGAVEKERFQAQLEMFKQVGMKSFPNEAIFTPKEKKKKTSDDGSTEPV